MDFFPNTIAIEITPSKFVRCHSVSVETTLMRRHSIGPGSRPKEEGQTWRGDHAFNSDAASFSLLNFIEPEIEATHPHLSKKEVHTLALEKFEHRLKQDLSFEHQENSHVDTTVHWTIVDGKNGKKELATTYGDEFVTLSQLWLHTRTYAEHIGNPLAYNKEEERAQLAMQDALINKEADSFVSVISHPDAIRYVQVWERSQSGDICSKQIDLYATTGRDFTHKEGEALVERITKYHQTVGTSVHTEDISYAHVFLTSGALTSDDIKTIAIAHAFTSEPRLIPVHQDMIRGIFMKTTKDIKETVVLLGKDFHTFAQKRVDDLKVWYAQKKEVQTSAFVHKTPLPIEVNNTETHEGVITKNVETTMQDVISEWIFEQTVLSYGTTHEVFVFGALDILTRKSIVSLPRSTHKENMLSPSEDIVTDSDMMPDVRTAVASVVLFLRHIMSKIHDRSDLVPQSTPTLIHNASREEFEKVFGVNEPTEYKSVESGILFIIQALIYFSLESEYIKKTDVSSTQVFIPTEKQLHIASSRALFGVVIWMIFQGLDQKSERSIHTDMTASDDEAVPKNSTKILEYFSTTPWILLSIIWYLSMLKESSISQPMSLPIATNTQQPTKQSQFPLSGVIYIFMIE